MKQHFLKYFTTLFSTLLITVSFSQTTIVKGTVRDATTRRLLQGATVSFPAGRGSITDANGSYFLQTQKPVDKIVVSYVGYKKDTISIKQFVEQDVDIDLVTDTSSILANVEVKRNRHKGYSNKNNPAVDLIRKVLEHKDSNRPQAYDYTQFEQYDKLEFSLSNPTQRVTNNFITKKYKFFMDNRDTAKIAGRSLLPVYLEETISKKYFRKDPKAASTKVVATRKVNFGEYVDNKGIASYLNFIYTDVDIYEPNIVFLTSQLQSPISALAPAFYMFTIQDTIVGDNGEKLVQLYFTPKNNGDVLFRGIMLITTDGNYAVQKVDMSISKNININFVRNIKVLQEFERSSDGRLHLAKSDLRTEFGLSQNRAAQGILGERVTSYKDYVINKPQPDSLYNASLVVDHREEHAEKPDSFWAANRHDTLTTAESKVFQNMDSLQKMKSFKRLMDYSTILVAGYKTFKHFEIGPLSTFYSFNPIEGLRLRAGGRTTTKFSTRWYLNAYGAYGFKDEKLKYFGSVTYSLNNRSVYQFPYHFIRASYQYDIKIPGQELEFVSDDNFLMSFKRGENDKYLYNSIYRIDYTHEYQNHFMYTLRFKRWEQDPTGALAFTKYINGVPVDVPTLTTSEIAVDLRYAPHESFYQTRTYRSPMYNKYPVFLLRYTQGIKGLIGGEYNYSNFQFNVFKKFFLGQFGYTHAVLDAGYIVGQVPYPLLTAHKANQTYAYQLQSYNLMNFLEFVSDHYVGLNIDHNFNGLIFNRIPVIKRLKWREELTFKILEGGIRSENDPALHPELFENPVGKNGVPITYTLNNMPYMEASVGIANIFRFLRVDLVRRLTYLDNPNVSKLGVRARFKLDF